MSINAQDHHRPERSSGGACLQPPRGVAALLAVTFGALLAALAPLPAAAHHDWSSSDYAHAYYLTGMVQEVVHWGNPHVELAIAIAQTPSPPARVRQWALPPGLVALGGQATLDRAEALPARLGGATIVVELPALPTLAERGFGAQPQPGETIEALGYLNKADDTLFRPEVIARGGGPLVQTRAYATGWPGDDGTREPAGGGLTPPGAASELRGTALLIVAGALVILGLRLARPPARYR